MSACLVGRGPGTVEYEIALTPQEGDSFGRRASLSR
jgi:hypothetical protein